MFKNKKKYLFENKTRTLSDIGLLKLLQELEGELVLLVQGLLSDDSLHGSGITTNGILGVELVRNISVILTGQLLTDGRLHKTRERRQNVDWWVDLTVVHLSVNEDLALSNESSQIGNRVSDI